ncbi:MAG: hypothetical protein ACYTKD_11280 [Planctomycetota bacterium]|jgi:hypothetical protein
MLALSNFALRFAEGRSGWVLVMALAAAGALVAWSYRSQILALRAREEAAGAASERRVARRTLVTLLVLRGVLVTVLVLFLFRPVVSFELRAAPKSTLAVVVDRSRSMAARDYEGLPHRLARAAGALAGRGGALGDLERDFRVRAFVFDSSARGIAKPARLFDETPDGGATDLVSGVRAAVEQCRADRADVASVLLMSDGIHTASPEGEAVDPASALAALGLPVHAVGVGESRVAEGSFRDVRVGAVRTPSAAPVRSAARVRVFVEAVGFAGRVVPVKIMEGDAEIARVDVTLDDLAGDQEVVLTVTPEETGQHEYRVVVPPDPAENVLLNNERSFFLNVTDPRIRVLYLEGAVRAEFRFLRRLLERDPQVEPVCLIKVRTGVFRRLGEAGDVGLSDFPRTKEELEPFDVFVIGDLDSTHFADGQLADVAREVREKGKGLLLMQGAAAFGAGGYGETELAPLLPVRVGSRDEPVRTGEFRPTLTPEGAAHPILEGLPPLFAPGATLLTPFTVMNAVARSPARGAVVLAERAPNQTEDGEAPRVPAPVIAAGRAGSGRVVTIAAGPTWRWAFAARDSRESSPHTCLWGQAVRWLAGEEEEKGAAGVALRLDRGEAHYKTGEAVTLYARVRGADGELAPTAEVTVEVSLARKGTEAAPADAPPGDPKEEESAQTIRLSPSPGRPGEFEAIFTPPRSGRHEVLARAADGGAAIGEATIRFDVETPAREDERVDIDEDALVAIAEATGGEYRRLAALGELVESLHSRQSEKVDPVVINLWDDFAPLIFCLVVTLAGTEWFLRRRMQLA